MAIQKSEAMLLSKRDIRETSCIANFYTKDFGKIRGLIKGVRGRDSKFGLFLQEFARYDIVYYEKNRSDIYMVTQCDLKFVYTDVSESLDKRLKAYYVLELVDKFSPLGEKNHPVYELLIWTLDAIEAAKFIDKAIILFRLKLLEYEGLLPQLDECVCCAKKISRENYFSIRLAGIICDRCRESDLQAMQISKGTIASINMIRKQGLTQLGRATIVRGIAEELQRLLDRFISYHLGEHLRTYDFIKQAQLQGVV